MHKKLRDTILLTASSITGVLSVGLFKKIIRQIRILYMLRPKGDKRLNGSENFNQENNLG